MIASGSVDVSKWENALKGTALLKVEDVVAAAVVPVVDDELLGVRALTGGVSEFAEGVNSGEEVSAFEPADVDPVELVEAAAPVLDEDEPL